MKWQSAGPCPALFFCRALETARCGALRAKPERIRQREQEARMTRPIVRRAVAERHGDAEIGRQVAAEEETHAAACRGQRRAIRRTPAVPPDEAAVDEAVELEAGEVCVVQFLIEAQFERAGNAVVAADLGRAIAASEGDAAE